ncbi:MAG: D-aminoacyl-tRNA deacylase, partial [Candidatus Hydrogenedentes bacterium]|nr:D-aminoacyl-tRNA deacylase [Candidatus Hydrogenedentota bacterium]
MRAVVQRVSESSVKVDDETIGEIGHGLLVLLGVAGDDIEDDASQIAKKVAQLRIFNDADGKFNLSLEDVGGAVLLISQFTLLGDARKGNRPSFIAAARPEQA